MTEFCFHIKMELSFGINPNIKDTVKLDCGVNKKVKGDWGGEVVVGDNGHSQSVSAIGIVLDGFTPPF